MPTDEELEAAEAARLAAWSEAGYDPLLYRALLIERGLLVAARPWPDPADLGYPLEYEPLGAEQPKDRDQSPWRKG